MNEKLVAYAMDFASFLVQNIGRRAPGIKSIILFGSVARGDARKNSDIDVFIDVFGSVETIEKKVGGITTDFYKSKKFTGHWKLLGINNEIKCKVGKLDEWKDLKPSIVANGMVLYGKYEGTIRGKNMVLVYWDKVRPESKRVLLSKKLYGYRYKGKTHKGIIEEASGMKTGTNCVVVPIDAAQSVLSVFKHMGISAKTMYISQYK